MGWKDVSSGEIVKWDQAKVLEGAFAGSEERATDFGENTIHSIEQADGSRVSFFGTTVLNDAFKQVTIGQLIRVEYTGRTRRTKKGFNVKEFIVQAWEREEDEAEKVPF